MKTVLRQGLLSFALLMCVAVAPVGAALIDRGNGLIFDDDLNVTWLEDANLAATNTFGVGGINPDGTMTWATANNWISAMNGENYKGFNNWRLPTTTQPDPSCSSQQIVGGFPNQGFGDGCTGSEMGHLAHVEGIDTSSPGVFDNLPDGLHWSGTEYAPDTNSAWLYWFDRTDQEFASKSGQNYVWALRDGDVLKNLVPKPVPEPTTMLLLGTGLAGLVAWRRKKVV